MTMSWRGWIGGRGDGFEDCGLNERGHCAVRGLEAPLWSNDDDLRRARLGATECSDFSGHPERVVVTLLGINVLLLALCLCLALGTLGAGERQLLQ